eukprot:2409545-Pyramimonas_sp.AAC.1
MSAMFVSLRRIGWDMKNMAVFIDDMGGELSRTLLSTALPNAMLHQAVLRQLERAAHGKLVDGDLFCGAGAPPPAPAQGLDEPA